MTQHPIQPTEIDEHGVRRFKANALVRYMVDTWCDLNKLSIVNQRGVGTKEDYDQLLQLIGYSVSGAPLSEMTRSRVQDSGVAVDYATAYRRGYKAAKKDMIAHLEEMASR